MVWGRDFALVDRDDGRKEAHSEAAYYAPYDHDDEAGGEGLDGAPQCEDDRADE